ncbi:MAG: phosphatidylglycerol lysyltransferase domain-containing protein [Desulfuromonadales bacterium]
MNRKTIKWISPLFALAIFLLALWTLNRALGAYRFADILRQLALMSPAMIAGAVALTVASYLLETGYDHLALHYLGRKLPPARITFASFISYAFSHNIGFSLLTGGSVRYRMYSSWGLSADQIACVTAFAAFSFILGLLSIGGLILLFTPTDLPDLPYFSLDSLWPIGALALAAVAGYLLLVLCRRRALRLRGWQLALPAPRQALLQILLGSTEWTVTASVLYPLLPEGADLSLLLYLQVYLLAQLVAMFSHVPGGLGVFESVFLLLVPGVSAPALFGSLLIYRAIYYLLPLVLGIMLLTIFETLQHGKRFRRAGAALGDWLIGSGPVLPDAGALALAQRIIDRYPTSFGHLFLLADKRLLFSPELNACLAFACGEHSLIVLGDMPGPAAQRRELAWRFREICDREGKWPVFFAIGRDDRAHCLELGLSPLPIGDDASLPLSGFSVESLDAHISQAYQDLRQTGCDLEVLPAAKTTDLAPIRHLLGEGHRQAAGNRFVQGWPKADFVRRFPVAILRQNNRIVACALLPAISGQERIVDFVHCAPDAPKETLPFLFCAICLWGSRTGITRLHLGMMPRAEAADDPLSPAWRQFGAHLFPHAEHFASLAELRDFKEKFSQDRSPRYLACPDVLALPEILADIARVGGKNGSGCRAGIHTGEG